MEVDIGIDLPTLMDEGYYSMINCAVNSQLENEEDLKLKERCKNISREYT